MSGHVRRVPDATHPITIARNPNRVVITVAGRVVADTLEALTLREANYPPVQYVPRKDVDMRLLERTDHATYCPTRGTAPISAFRWAASARPMRSGPMSNHTTP